MWVPPPIVLRIDDATDQTERSALVGGQRVSQHEELGGPGRADRRGQQRSRPHVGHQPDPREPELQVGVS